MATMNISLPNQMKNWVEENVQSGRYANSSDYMRDLIRRDKDRGAALAQMQAMISEGIDSGDSGENLDDIWNRVKSRNSNG